MSHDDITAAIRPHLRREVTRIVRSATPHTAPEQRGKPATGPARRRDGSGTAGRRPRRAAGERRVRGRWSVRDRIGAVVAGTGASAVLTTMALAAAAAPTAAYGAIGAIGAGATAATGIYLSKR